MGQGANTSFRLTLGATMTAGVILLAAFPPWGYGFYPSCPFHEWTGLLCPGCGGTRALAALLHGRFAAAWQWNQLVTASALPGLGYMTTVLVRGRWLAMPPGVWLAVAAVATGFTLWRNLG